MYMQRICHAFVQSVEFMSTPILGLQNGIEGFSLVLLKNAFFPRFFFSFLEKVGPRGGEHINAPTSDMFMVSVTEVSYVFRICIKSNNA